MSRAGIALFGGGDLDEVAVYDRALSAATIAEHFGSTAPTAGPPRLHGLAERARARPDRDLRRIGLD